MVPVDPRKPRLEIAESEGFIHEKLPSLSLESNRQRKRGLSLCLPGRACPLGSLKPVPRGGMSLGEASWDALSGTGGLDWPRKAGFEDRDEERLRKPSPRQSDDPYRRGKGGAPTKSTAGHRSRFLRIVEDPWLAGMALREQWTQMPKLCRVYCQGPTVPVFASSAVREFRQHKSP